MNIHSVSVFMKVVAVSLVMVFSTNQLRANDGISASGSVEQIWADKTSLFPGRSGGIWVTLSDNPLDWIYVTDHTLASAALGVFKTTGATGIEIYGVPWGTASQGYHSMANMFVDNFGPLYGSTWIRTMLFLYMIPNPFLAVIIVDETSQQESMVLLSTPEQAEIAATSISTTENISYDTTCAYFYITETGIVEEFCNAADWIAIQN